MVIPKAGVQNDEALFANPIYFNTYNDLSVTVFGHRVALMVMSYLGTLKTLLYWPIFGALGVSVWTVRIPTLLVGTLTLFLFYRLAQRSDRAAALVGTALLATDPTFLLTNTFDWGPVAIGHFLLVTACVCLVHFNQKTVSATTSGMYLFLGFFCLGLAVWNKAIFLWALAGLIAAGLLVFWREIQRAFRPRNVALAATGFVLGALPFEIYNLKQPNVTLGTNANLDTKNALAKFVVVRDTLDGRGLFGFLTTPEEDAHPKSVRGVSTWIREHFGMHRRSGLQYVFFAALLAVPLWWRSRAARFSLVFLIVTWTAMAITKDAGAAVHHTALLWPFPQLFLAVTLAAFRWSRLVVIPIVAMNLLVLNQYIYEFERFGAGGNFTDALFPLSSSIPDTQQPVYVVDWGMLNTLSLFHQGRLLLRPADEFFRTGTPTPFQQQQIGLMFAMPDALFIGHVPEREMNPGINQHFDEATRAQGYRKDSVQVIPDSNGRPVFEVFRLRK